MWWLWTTLLRQGQSLIDAKLDVVRLQFNEYDVHIECRFWCDTVIVFSILDNSPESRNRDRLIAELEQPGTMTRIRVYTNVCVYVIGTVQLQKNIQLINVTNHLEWLELICFSLLVHRLVDWSSGESVPCHIPTTVGSPVLFLKGQRRLGTPIGTMYVYMTPSRYVILFVLVDVDAASRCDIELKTLFGWLKGILRESELRALVDAERELLRPGLRV